MAGYVNYPDALCRPGFPRYGITSCLPSSSRNAIGKVSSTASASAETVAEISSAAKRCREVAWRQSACCGLGSSATVYAGTGSAYRKLSTRMTSLLSASNCV